MNESQASLFDLSGKVALLTGAGRGIGLAMAKALAGAGCAIALQDIDLPVAQQEAEAINAAGGKAIAYGGDIADLTLAATLVGEVMNGFGRLDVLVNNASIQTEKHWMELTVEEMEHDFHADLLSPILFIRQVWPIFKNQRFGRIINMGSIQQQRANPGMFPYSISKGGLEKITQGLAREMARSNVTINQIAPGWISATHRNRHNLTTPEVVEDLGRKHVPVGRLGDPRDFRGVILLLCSEAGNYITGQTIFVDGGLSA
jgi:NAD(P)-dependent dehydrogenase (short-subunit alcohol dehydrogenase family)